MGYVDSLNGIFTKKREKEINKKIKRDFEKNYLEKGVLNVIDCGIIGYDVFEHSYKCAFFHLLAS